MTDLIDKDNVLTALGELKQAVRDLPTDGDTALPYVSRHSVLMLLNALEDAAAPTVSCEACDHHTAPGEDHPWVYVGDGVYTTDPREYTEPCGRCYCGSKFKWQP